MQKAKTNGHDTDDEVEQVLDELGLQEEILSSSESNPLLKDTNLGLGKYDDDYRWQQVRSYRKGLYAWIAFGNVLTKREFYETKVKLGAEGWHSVYDDDEMTVRTWESWDEAEGKHAEVGDEESTWTAKLRRGRHIWKLLGDPERVITRDQIAAVQQKTGIVDDWKPLFWELVAGRHEVSRSVDAELLRDALTGIKEIRENAETEESIL
jgi:hypothetical protein